MTTFIDEEYIDRSFKGVKALNQQLKFVEFEACRFTNGTFREASFHDCLFRDCLFKDCDLSLVQLKNSAFISTHFQACQIVGVNWSEANWDQRGFLKSVDFTQCVLNYSTFFGLDLHEASFTNCIAKEVDFAEANLTQANCTNTDFTGSRFHATNLSKADFRGATNYSIVPSANTLKKARFSLPEAVALLHGLDIVLE